MVAAVRSRIRSLTAIVGPRARTAPTGPLGAPRTATWRTTARPQARAPSSATCSPSTTEVAADRGERSPRVQGWSRGDGRGVRRPNRQWPRGPRAEAARLVARQLASGGPRAGGAGATTAGIGTSSSSNTTAPPPRSWPRSANQVNGPVTWPIHCSPSRPSTVSGPPPTNSSSTASPTGDARSPASPTRRHSTAHCSPVDHPAADDDNPTKCCAPNAGAHLAQHDHAWPLAR